MYIGNNKNWKTTGTQYGRGRESIILNSFAMSYQDHKFTSLLVYLQMFKNSVRRKITHTSTKTYDKTAYAIEVTKVE